MRRGEATMDAEDTIALIGEMETALALMRSHLQELQDAGCFHQDGEVLFYAPEFEEPIADWAEAVEAVQNGIYALQQSRAAAGAAGGGDGA